MLDIHVFNFLNERTRNDINFFFLYDDDDVERLKFRNLLN